MLFRPDRVSTELLKGQKHSFLEARTDFMYQWLHDVNIYTLRVDQYN